MCKRKIAVGFILLLRKPFFVTFRAGGIRVGAEDIQTGGPEKMTFRIDKIPFAFVFFQTEPAGRLEFRTRRPSAETVPGRGRRRLLQFGELALMLRNKIGIAVNFLRPLGMFVLTVLVDEREILIAHSDRFPCGVGRAFKTEIGQFAVQQPRPAGFKRPLHFEFYAVDLRCIKRIFEIPAAFRRGKQRRMRKINAHRAFLSGIQTDSAVDLTVRKIHMTGTLLPVARTACNVHRHPELTVFGAVLNIHRKISCAGKIEFAPFRRIDPQTGIPFRRVRLDADHSILHGGFRPVTGFQLLRLNFQFSRNG